MNRLFLNIRIKLVNIERFWLKLDLSVSAEDIEDILDYRFMITVSLQLYEHLIPPSEAFFELVEIERVFVSDRAFQVELHPLMDESLADSDIDFIFELPELSNLVERMHPIETELETTLVLVALNLLHNLFPSLVFEGYLLHLLDFKLLEDIHVILLPSDEIFLLISPEK